MAYVASLAIKPCSEEGCHNQTSFVVYSRRNEEICGFCAKHLPKARSLAAQLSQDEEQEAKS